MKRSNVCGGLFAGVLTLGFIAGPAEAAFIYSATESDTGVIFIGEGTIDLTGLNLLAHNIGGSSGVVPQSGYLTLSGIGDAYTGFTGPTAFGSGGFSPSSSQIGSLVALSVSQNIILVPGGYVSGSSLSNSLIFAGATFASLGLNPGAYIYNFGSGANADTFTVRIGAVVPEPATWAMMIAGFGMIGAGTRYRQRRTVLRYG